MKSRIAGRTVVILAGIAVVLVLGACAPIFGFFVPNEYEVAGVSGTFRNAVIYDLGSGPDGGTYVGIALLTDSLAVKPDGRLSGSGDVVYFIVLSENDDLGFIGTYDYQLIEEIGELVLGFVYVDTVYDQNGNYTYGSYTQVNGGTMFIRRPLIGDMVVTFDVNTLDGLLTGQYRGSSVDTGVSFIPVDLTPSTLSGSTSGSILPDFNVTK